MKAIKISTTSNIEVIDLTMPLHKSVREQIGGFLEHVLPRRLPEPYCMIVDDEGLLKGLPVNAIGSYFYESDKHGSPIVGDILLMKDGYTNEGYDIIGLEQSDIDYLLNLLGKETK